jgi:hypothetical protein
MQTIHLKLEIIQMARALRQTGRVIGAGAGAVALLGLGYMGITWYRYGTVARNRRRDPLVDSFMPKYEVREVHETKVAAPAELTYAVAKELDLQKSTIVRAIFTGRELLMGAEHSKRENSASFLAEVLDLGWRVLAEDPGHELVVGAATQPWNANVEFRGIPSEEFAAFDEPGYAKIIFTLAADSAGPNRSVFHTETRVLTTDPESRQKFRLYWSVFSPGILLIRYEMLRLVKNEAERRVALQHYGEQQLVGARG